MCGAICFGTGNVGRVMVSFGTGNIGWGMVSFGTGNIGCGFVILTQVILSLCL